MKSLQQRLEQFFFYHAYLHAAVRLYEVYFYSFRLLDIIQRDFFSRFSAELNHGQSFCYEISAMVMLALRSCKSARIVRGICDRGDDKEKDEAIHSWVEFRYLGVWYVIDPCWLELFIVRRDKYYDELQPRIFFTCRHREFWRYEICRQFRACMERPETSYIFTELTFPFVSDRLNAEYCVFSQDIATTRIRYDGSRKSEMVYMMLTSRDDFYFCPRIVAEYMARPSRRYPKARTLRHYTALRQWMRHDYAEQYGPL